MERKVLYCGNSDTHIVFDDVAKLTQTKIVPFYAVTATKDDIIWKVLSDNYEMVILNIDEILETNAAVDIINSIVKSNKTKLVVMAPGYSNKSHLVVEAAKAGVEYFMIDKDISSAKEVYKNTLANIKNVHNIIDPYISSGYEFNVNTTPEDIVSASQRFNSISVSVAGCMPRIGTTSVAIQLVKFFQSQGKTACYIDNSSTDYISLCRDYYYVSDEDAEMHRVTFEGVDIYYNITAEIMQQIYIKNYNFMVFDTGNIADNPEKQTLFLQKKYRLLCTGCKPNEYMSFQRLLENIYKTNISYMYFSVPLAEREDIQDDVSKIGQKCYFVPFFDDCFSLVQDSVPMFGEIFKGELPQPEIEELDEPKKKGWFRNRKKKKKG